MFNIDLLCNKKIKTTCILLDGIELLAFLKTHQPTLSNTEFIVKTAHCQI